MSYSDDLIPFMQAWEGLKLVPSRDRLASGEVWDVGYGHVLMAGEQRRPITSAEALELLHWDLTLRADVIADKMLRIMVEQHQADGLLAFSYNVGLDDDDDTKPEGLGDSRLLRMVNAGNFDAATEEFDLWVRAGGKVIPGLVKRRAAERAIFERGDYSGRP